MAEVSDSELARLMDKACEAVMQPFQEPIKSFYLDSDFLYDYRLGALLLKIKNDEQYQYVLKHLDEYLEGPSPKITAYFPELGITEEELDKFESDPNVEKILQLAAPGTELLYRITDVILKINTSNGIKTNAVPLTIYINQRKHLMPDSLKRRIVDYIRNVDPGVSIAFMHVPSWKQFPMDVFAKINIFFVYNMIDFCHEDSAVVPLMKEDKVKDKIVLANFIAEDKFEKADELDDAIAKFSGIMSLMFLSFQFVNKTVLIER